MKKCVVIINPKSGKGLIKKYLEKIEDIITSYGYRVKIIITEYPRHATKIIKGIDNDIDLVISVGGDGTFSEVMNGNLLREKPLVLSHLPVGTTNDIGYMYGLGNHILTNLKLILDGCIKELDVGLINNHAFTYVASFGKFMDIPYKTPQELKRSFGYFAYIIEVFKRIFDHIPRYEITYTINGEEYHGKYTFIIISNANRIAGINNFYEDVKLDDSCFEVMLCSLSKKRDILKAIYTLKTSTIKKVSGIEIYKAREMEIIFKDNDNKPWCVDGEEFFDDKNRYIIGLRHNVKMQIPNINISRLFVKK